MLDVAKRKGIRVAVIDADTGEQDTFTQLKRAIERL